MITVRRDKMAETFPGIPRLLKDRGLLIFVLLPCLHQPSLIFVAHQLPGNEPGGSFNRWRAYDKA